VSSLGKGCFVLRQLKILKLCSTMKKSIFGLLVGLFGLLAGTNLRAAETLEEVNMSIKVSPSNPRIGEPVICEAVPSGGNGTYHIGWWLDTKDQNDAKSRASMQTVSRNLCHVR